MEAPQRRSSVWSSAFWREAAPSARDVDRSTVEYFSSAPLGARLGDRYFAPPERDKGSMSEIKVQVNNGPAADVPAPITVAEALKKLDRDVARQALAARVNGQE